MENCVKNAIINLNEREGSSAFQIFSYIKANRETLLPNSQIHNLVLYVRRYILRSLSSSEISMKDGKYQIVSREKSHKAKSAAKELPSSTEFEKKQGSVRKSVVKSKSSTKFPKQVDSSESHESVRSNEPSSTQINPPPGSPNNDMEYYTY